MFTSTPRVWWSAARQVRAAAAAVLGVLVFSFSRAYAQSTVPVTVVNRATVSGSGMVPASASAAFTVLAGGGGPGSAGGFVLRKSANRALATAGDTVTYTLAWTAPGGAAAFMLEDALPAVVSYLPGSLVVNGSPAADPAGASSGMLRLGVTALPAGGSGSARFAVVVGAAGTAGTLRNFATARLEGDSVRSDTASTALVGPAIDLSMVVLTDSLVRAGSRVQFRLRVRNRSAGVALRPVLVTDTLPLGLAFGSTDVAPDGGSAISASLVGDGSSAANGGGSVRWRLPELAAGDSADLLLTGVVLGAANGVLVNRATAVGTAAALVASASAAGSIAVQAATGALTIEKSAAVLEAGLGDAVGYRIRLHNAGALPLSGVVVHDRLPEGTALQAGSPRGDAHFSSAAGQLSATLTAPLAAGGDAELSYALTIVSPAASGVLENVAWATADALVGADTARALVRLRAGAAMQSRALIGRVFLDRDGNGRQDAGESGVAGAVLWGAHGEAVRSDEAGRFSFRDLVPGRYVLRVDPLSVPAGWQASAAERNGVAVRIDGWTTPEVRIGLVPAAAMVATSKAAPGAAQPAADVARTDSVAAPRIPGFRVPAQGLSLGDLLGGPALRIEYPADGAVLSDRHVLVRVQGEAHAPVTVEVDGRAYASSSLRPDGSADFVGVPFEPGTHSVVVRSTISGRPAADSVRLHVSGSPRKIVPAADSLLLRGGRDEQLRFRVLDGWGVPVTTGVRITVSARGATVLTPDVDSSSVGTQVQVAADGTGVVALRGDSLVAGELTLSAAGAPAATVALRVRPELRPLMVTGDGSIGLGASHDRYGAIMARGALDAGTALTLSYDSRRNAGRQDAGFAGSYDPLEESRYPVLGDASRREFVVGAQGSLALRLDRGASMLAMGEVETNDFADARSLASYPRALRGAKALLNGGALQLRGFGSYTDQQVASVQLRGDGTSGPYALGGRVRMGTERIAVEVRDRLDAARVIARRELARFVDYEIDYTTGLLLLKEAVPSADAAGNSVFLVITAERSGGALSQSFVGGVRADLDLLRFAGADPADSLVVGGAMIGDAVSARGGQHLASGNVRLKLRGLSATAELARAAALDSAGQALRGELQYDAGAKAGVHAEWLSVRSGFVNPANPRLVGGTSDLRLDGHVRPSDYLGLEARHTRQEFTSFGTDRQETGAKLELGPAGHRALLDVALSQDHLGSGVDSAFVRSLTSRLTLSPLARLSIWGEDTRTLRHTGTLLRPPSRGVGASYDVFKGIKLEASRRVARLDSSDATISSIGFKSDLGSGTRASSEYQVSSTIDGWTNAVALSLGQRVQLGRGWSADGMYERRVGLSHMAVIDPLRALPFPGADADRQAGSAALAWAPGKRDASFSARGEAHKGTYGKGYRTSVAADASLRGQWALLLRQEMQREIRPVSAGPSETEAIRSLVGLAFRPAGDALNLLAKAEWRRDVNPLGGAVLSGVGSADRKIGALELVTLPRAGTELGLRYAVRFADVSGNLGGGMPVGVRSHFLGARASQHLAGALELRLNARALAEAQSGSSRGDVSAGLGLVLPGGLDLEGGYRAGNLLDFDFAENGGPGLYGAIGVRFTERVAQGIASFWRQRVENE